MLILWTRLLRIQYRRWRARSAARAWIAELDAVKADWGASGELWELIGQWMAADALNNQEFLVLFRMHHRRGHAAPTSRYVADRRRSRARGVVGCEVGFAKKMVGSSTDRVGIYLPIHRNT